MPTTGTPTSAPLRSGNRGSAGLPNGRGQPTNTQEAQRPGGRWASCRHRSVRAGILTLPGVSRENEPDARKAPGSVHPAPFPSTARTPLPHRTTQTTPGVSSLGTVPADPDMDTAVCPALSAIQPMAFAPADPRERPCIRCCACDRIVRLQLGDALSVRTPYPQGSLLSSG